jgi:hypothetical protein
MAMLRPVSLAVLLIFGGWLTAPLRAQSQDPPLAQTPVTGIVVDEAGDPISGIEVRRLYRDMRASTRTDAGGKFTIDVSTDSRSPRTLVARNDAGSLQGYFSFEGGPIKADVAPRLVLRKSRQVDVAVIGSDQRPIADANVELTSSYWPLCEGQTDQQGKAALLVPADAPLEAVVARKQDVGFDYVLYRTAGELASDPYRLPQDHAAPITLALTGTRTLTVRVVDEQGHPLAGAMVHPFYIECPKKGGIFQIGRFGQATDETGRAVFRIIPASNTSIISFRAKLANYDVRQRWEFDPAQPGNEVQGTLVRLIPLRGTVTDSQGQPAAGATVSVAGAGYQTEGFYGSVISQADGRFEILVKPDHYYLVAAAREKEASPTAPLVIRADQTPEPLQLALQPATRIRGKLTAVADDQPLAERYVTLRYDDELYYHSLPEEQKLPNPLADNRGISPSLSQSAKSGPQGQFEFWVGPGRYSVSTLHAVKSAKLKAQGQAELVADLQAADLQPFAFTGRVVTKDDPTRGVAEATVTGWPTPPFLLRRLQAVTDAEGKFRALRHPSEMYRHAKTSNGLLGGMLKITADAKEATIPIGPLASAHGRLVDEATGLPLPGQQIEFAFLIESGRGGGTWQFGGKTTTNERGEFTADGLVPAFPFDINVVTQTGPEGRASQWNTVAKVTALKAELVELGDVKLPPPLREMTLEERAAGMMKVGLPLEVNFKARLRDAKLGNQRLLVFAADTASPTCREFHVLRHGDASQVRVADRAVNEALDNYAFMPVDCSPGAPLDAARPWLEQLGAPVPEAGQAVLAVVETDGRLLKASSAAELSTGGRLDAKKLPQFLVEHAPRLPDAGDLLADALAEARKSGRRVLVQYGRHRGPNLQLSRFFDEQAALIGKDYVRVRIDVRSPRSEEVLGRLLTNPEDANPWFAILDADGKPLITSSGPSGNIGFPSDAAGIAHFEKMLRSTAQKLTAEEIASLIKALTPSAP